MMNLNLKIKLEILGTDMVIEDADVSVNIKKTDEAQPNYCTCTIYNLSDNTYNKLMDKANSVRVYINYQDEINKETKDTNWILVFQGDLRDLKKFRKASTRAKKKTSKKRKSSNTSSGSMTIQHYNEPPIRREGDVDIQAIIELQDGIKGTFIDTFYSKSYSGKISNRQIIKDCVEYLKKNNIPVGRIDTIPEKTYVNGKVVHGQVINILKSITSDVNCTASCQNNVFSIINNKNENPNYSVVLDGDICEKPNFDTDKRIKVNAPLLATVNPTDYIQLNFVDVSGAYAVSKIEHNFDNFGQDYSSEVELKY